MQSVLAFITQLKQNNTREWFEQHRAEYETAKSDFEQFVRELLANMISYEPAFAALEPRKCVFRIYRDIRFSKDKTPYKTNFGAYFTESGKNSTKSGYYLHIEPGDKSMLAGGMYMPAADVLKKIRQEIDYNRAAFHRVLDEPAFKKYYGTVTGSQLKTAPRDYPADHPDIDLLRLKDFTGVHSLRDNQVTDPKFAAYAADGYRALKPLNTFLNQAVE